MRGSWLEGCPNPCELSCPPFLLWLTASLPITENKNLWVLEIHCSFDETVVHACMCVC